MSALARHTDPATSHDAAAAAHVNRLQGIVLQWLYEQGPEGGTSRQCAEDTGIDRVALSPRFRPLEECGLIVRTDRRIGRSGVWVHSRWAGVVA